MSVFSYSSKVVKPNFRMLVLPVTALIALLILILTIIKLGFGQISQKQNDLKESKRIENLLSAKLESLRSIDKNILEKEDLTLVAVPSQNPVLQVYYQINQLSKTKGLQLSNRKYTSSVKDNSGLSGSTITFNLAGEYPLITSFLTDFDKDLSLSTIDKVEVKIGEKTSAEVSIKDYWADLPTQLSALTEPVRKLNPEELELLKKLESYTFPTYSVVNPSGPYDRQDPFN